MSQPTALPGPPLAAVLEDAQVFGRSHVPLASCTHDWHQVQPGDVFVAISDVDADGHDHATEAVERGAVAVVCERPLPVFQVPQWVVSDSRHAYGQICQAVLGNPAQELKLIGVTGTAGKSTVVALVQSILNAAGHRTGSLGSLGLDDGFDNDARFDTSLSSPSVASGLARMVASRCTHAVVELSSEALAQSRLAGLSLDALCVTNIGRDHLDVHSTVENYRRAKARAFDLLDPTGVAVLNADDTVCMRHLATLDQPAITYGLRRPAEISATVFEQHNNEQVFVMTNGHESAAVRTPIIGEQHVSNCLAATTLALAYGIDLLTIARGLEAVESLPGRLERVACGQDFAVFVDAADTPDKLRGCLRAVRHVTAGRLICVFGAGTYQPPEARRLLGAQLERMADLVVLTDGHSLGEDPREVSAAVLHGIKDHRQTELIVDRASAIRHALAEARAGDTVVVAGRGEACWPASRADAAAVDDRVVVKELLDNLQTAAEVGSMWQ